MVFLYFWTINIVALWANRRICRGVLRYLRKKGYNQRTVLIVGSGVLGQRVANVIRSHPEAGIQIVGFLTRRPLRPGTLIQEISVLGLYEDVAHLIKTRDIDQVIFALPLEDQPVLNELLQMVDEGICDVKIVPDLTPFKTLRGGAEMFEGLPFITLRDTPLYGWNRILKRSIDILFSALFLGLSAPLFPAIAFLIRLSSPGPIFYRQLRMGLDGKPFQMLKFRTMQADAEEETGPVWASPRDPRCTRLGAFLRRTSLDELPQLWNVLKGEMSIVGPRPERPEFVERFRSSVPRYMLRHKMKAGITGLAQINGWRGNTSLEERIKCDLEYIEKWSLALDLKIMWLTIWKGLINKNAY